MVSARIVERPETFDRVDRVKRAVGQEVLPGDDRLWILGQPLGFIVDDEVHVVPHGFTTDGASIPWIGQLLTGWKPWDEPQRLPAIVHDFTYCTVDSRRWCDQVFHALLREEGASPFRSDIMYWAVRLGGWKAYGSDQKEGPKIFN